MAHPRLAQLQAELEKVEAGIEAPETLVPALTKRAAEINREMTILQIQDAAGLAPQAVGLSQKLKTITDRLFQLMTLDITKNTDMNNYLLQETTKMQAELAGLQARLSAIQSDVTNADTIIPQRLDQRRADTFKWFKQGVKDAAQTLTDAGIDLAVVAPGIAPYLDEITASDAPPPVEPQPEPQ